jgi:hypothetical protein
MDNLIDKRCIRGIRKKNNGGKSQKNQPMFIIRRELQYFLSEGRLTECSIQKHETNKISIFNSYGSRSILIRSLFLK